jgi:hypothetical protein
VLLRPLPYRDPGRLAVILESSEKHGGAFSLAPANYLDFRDRNHSFSSMAAAEVWGPSLTGSGEAEELHGLRASASLFEVLGVQAAAGRVFLPEDERPGAAPVVVIGAGLWKRRFGGDPNVIGRSITLNQASYTVAGATELLLPSVLGARRGDLRSLVAAGESAEPGHEHPPRLRPPEARRDLGAGVRRHQDRRAEPGAGVSPEQRGKERGGDASA